MFTAIKKWLHRMFGKTEEKTVQPVKTTKKLSRADKKQIEAAISRANRTDKKGKSAQDSMKKNCEAKMPVWWSWILCSTSTERDRRTPRLLLPKAHGLRCWTA